MKKNCNRRKRYSHRGKRGVVKVRRQQQDLFFRTAAVVEKPRAVSCCDSGRSCCAGSLCKAIVQGADRRSPRKIFVRGLKIRYLFKLPINDHRARPLQVSHCRDDLLLSVQLVRHPWCHLVWSMNSMFAVSCNSTWRWLCGNHWVGLAWEL
jgi:hypothetical protein